MPNVFAVAIMRSLPDMSMGTVSPQSNLCEMKPLDPRKMMNGSSLSVRKRFFLSNVEYVWDLIFIGWDWKRVTA